MKKVGVIILALVGLFYISCSNNQGVETVYETGVIPSDKAGVVISNPFKDNTKFDSRAITYYSKYDVEYYQISVWYTDALNDAEQTAENVLSTLKISKEDSYTSKVLTFDNEGTYVLKCEAFCGDELIAEDTATKQLSFANAEFIIFYLVPKIKLQTADVGVTISWVGDDSNAIVHTLRFVRPSDEIDTTISILANGKCAYNEEDYLPVIIYKSNNGHSNWTADKIPLSMVSITSMVGKIADSYSFSITVSPNATALETYDFQLYSDVSSIFTWTRTYTESNTKAAETFTDYRLAGYNSVGSVPNAATWVLLDGKIVQTLASSNSWLSSNEYTTIEAIQQKWSTTIDSYGNIIAIGDYVGTFCDKNSNDTYWTYRNSDEYIGFYMNDNESLFYSGKYDGTFWDASLNECTAEDKAEYGHTHYLIFKATKTPYSF